MKINVHANRQLFKAKKKMDALQMPLPSRAKFDPLDVKELGVFASHFFSSTMPNLSPGTWKSA